MKFKAFTLTEIMVVLLIIGVLAGVLFPVANNARPDKNVMKFKKAHAVLYNTVREMVSAKDSSGDDKYFKDGDLGVRPNGHYINGSYTGDYSYFCEIMADILSANKVDCKNSSGGGYTYYATLCNSYNSISSGKYYRCTSDITADMMASKKALLDTRCKESASSMPKEIETTDGVVYYRATAHTSSLFGHEDSVNIGGQLNLRRFSPPDKFPANYSDQDGFDVNYGIMCIDVDGSSTNSSCDDVNDICPFGYGIRADGKILSGARADEWMAKGFHKGKSDN